MQGLRAQRIKITIGSLWESPPLHILLTREEGLVVARCLDFTVSSHGENEPEAILAVAESVKEYLLSAAENQAFDTIFDPAQGKYWRMFNELDMSLSNAVKS